MENKKIAVVTGTSSGIGLEIANMLSENGFVVYGISRRVVQTNQFKSISCDVTNYTKINDVINNIIQTEGKIDVLVNNAGRGFSGAYENMPFENIKSEFELNYFALSNLCQKIIPIMRENGGGNIVNISSLAGVFPIPYQAGYSATKSAVNNLTLALRNEVKPFNIKVSAVMPGDTNTGFTSARVKVEQQGVYKNIEKSIGKMEKDEKNGMSSQSVAKVVVKLLKSKNPKPLVSVGFKNKLLVFLQKMLPTRLMVFIVRLLYC